MEEVQPGTSHNCAECCRPEEESGGHGQIIWDGVSSLELAGPVVGGKEGDSFTTTVKMGCPCSQELLCDRTAETV